MKSTKDAIFRARDLKAVKAFYGGKLGLPLIAESDSLVGFDTGAFTLYFELGEPDGPVFEFTVDDAARAKADLIAGGCVVIEENPAVPRIYLRDPFGLVFNITEA